ncbi:MAG: hypothetical protein HOY69_27405 [Streptomyces sp.]|nr:hypothetical protein [Streptomyces sp.]
MPVALPRRRVPLLAVLSLAGALLVALPATAAADQVPVDPSLPVPTVPATDVCGATPDAQAWMTVSDPAPAGEGFIIGIPRPQLSGQHFQGVVHVFDTDGSASADGVADQMAPLTQSVYVPLTLHSGHTYGWYAATYDGTSYSPPAATCYVGVDGDSPTGPVITDPDFPPDGSGGTPKKSDGQPSTFTFTSHEALPAGCVAAGPPDCRVSGLDHFIYAVDTGMAGIGQPQVPADADGSGSVTLTLGWGTHTLYVAGVDAAGNRRNEGTYTFYVPWKLPPPMPAGAGTYHPVRPARLLDTRTTGPSVPAGRVTKVQVAGNSLVPGIPATGITAVVLNVTATRTAGAGVLTAWGDGDPRPATSNLNWSAANRTVSNLVTVPVPAGGAVDLAATSGAALIADIQGYYTHDTTGVTLTAVAPYRLFDTRTGSLSSTAPVTDTTFTVGLAGQGGVPTDATAVVVNLTATGTSGAGYLEAFPGGTPAPGVSNINWTASGTTVAGLAVVPLGTDGSLSVLVHGTTHVVADVFGYFDPGSSGADFTAVRPARLLDTRHAIGVATTTPLPSGHSLALRVTGGAGGVPAGARAVLVNVTVTATTGAGVLTAWAGGSPRPATSNLNWTAAQQTVPNLVLVPVGVDGTVDLYVNSTTHVVADLFGYYA